MGKKKNVEEIQRKKIRKNVIIGIVILLFAISAITFAMSRTNINKSEYTAIKFSDMYTTENNLKDVSQKLKMLDGKKVLLKGYMAEQSPIDESFIYLVNEPFVVCPFCTLGDITKLDVMSVYMANGTPIKFRNDPVEIYGTLEVEAKEDSFGYTTQFRILADRIETMQETQGNPQKEAYYNQLNQDDVIFYITSTQMNIDGVVNPDYLAYWGETKEEIVDSFKDSTDFIQQLEDELITFNHNIQIVQAIDPVDEEIKKLNEEFLKIYQDQKATLEKLLAIVKEINEKELTKEQKLEQYNAFVALSQENLEIFDRFNTWNNKLRE